MAIDIVDTKVGLGGSFYKPGDFLGTYEGMLVEVHRIRKGQLKDYNGNPIDGADVTITAFKSVKDKSPLVGDFTIDKPHMVSALEGLEGKATILKQGQGKAKQGRNPAWVWAEAEAGVKKAIIAFASKRDEQLKAEAEDAPDFD